MEQSTSTNACDFPPLVLRLQSIHRCPSMRQFRSNERKTVLSTKRRCSLNRSWMNERTRVRTSVLMQLECRRVRLRNAISCRLQLAVHFDIDCSRPRHDDDADFIWSFLDGFFLRSVIALAERERKHVYNGVRGSCRCCGRTRRHCVLGSSRHVTAHTRKMCSE
jgi:hypothetical protein